MEIQFPEKFSFLLQESARYKVLWGGRGAGKCLALGTKVIMADGSLRAIENIWPNESVMGPDSKPRKVLGITRGRDIMYKIKQTSGIDYIVNSAHILSLKKSKSAIKDVGKISKAGNPKRPNGRYSSYNNITNINVVEVLNQSKRWKEHFRGYKAGLLNFEIRPIIMDPWFLGAWLGDGKSVDTTIYSMDDEVINAIIEYANKLNMKVTFYEQKSKAKAISIRKNLGSGRNSDLFDKFYYYKLFNNKHIPDDFKFNSEEIRLQVLAGLLDTDGHMKHNGYQIAQTNKILANDIKFLADSLGFRTNIREKITICGNNGVKGLATIISIDGDTWRIPCKIIRKQVKKEDVRKNKDFLLSQIEIECIGEGEYAGFSLDGDHLFLLEDGTVTHNTENIARALIIWCVYARKKLRILCLRELQTSISESVYETIKNAIYDMELEDEFIIQATTIISKRTNSEFIFAGLRYNINKIKSLARIDIAWCEEAVNISKTSWDKLNPTIRGRHENDPNGMGGPFGKGPEIWVSFNPELDDDETYQRFVLFKDKYVPDYITNEKGEKERYAIVVKVNHDDNPFFPTDLKREMELLKTIDEVSWLNVWEGHTKQTLDGAIYADELKQIILENRIGKVPYDQSRPVHTFWDLGHSDQTGIWFIQTVGVEYNVINYYQNRLKKVGHYLEHMQSLNYIYGTDYLPHDADNETLASMSVQKIMNKAGRKTKLVPRVAKKFLGINAARTVFPLCNFDEEHTADGLQCLRRYCYAVNEETGNFSKEPKHDQYSHGADAFQTFALSLKSETATKSKKPINIAFPLRIDTNSWMG